MTAIAWILITVGSAYYLGERRFLHGAVFVAAVILLRGVVGDVDPNRFIETHQNRIMQQYERVLEPSEDNRQRAKLSRYVK